MQTLTAPNFHSRRSVEIIMKIIVMMLLILLLFLCCITVIASNSSLMLHQVMWSVSLSVCLSRLWALRKQLNRSRCHLGAKSSGFEKPWGCRSSRGRGNVWGCLPHWKALGQLLWKSICWFSLLCKIWLDLVHWFWQHTSFHSPPRGVTWCQCSLSLKFFGHMLYICYYYGHQPKICHGTKQTNYHY